MLPMKERMENLSSLKVLIVFYHDFNGKKGDLALTGQLLSPEVMYFVISGLQGTGIGCSLSRTWSQVTRRL